MKAKLFMNLLIFFIIIMPPIKAHEFPICRSIYDNSCWSIENASSSKFTMLCENKEKDFIFSVNELKSREKWSYQFCSGYNDGLGYAAEEVKCRILLADGKTQNFTFISGNPGQRVRFMVENTALHIEVLSSAKSPAKRIKSVMRP